MPHQACFSCLSPFPQKHVSTSSWQVGVTALRLGGSIPPLSERYIEATWNSVRVGGTWRDSFLQDLKGLGTPGTLGRDSLRASLGVGTQRGSLWASVGHIHIYMNVQLNDKSSRSDWIATQSKKSQESLGCTPGSAAKVS